MYTVVAKSEKHISAGFNFWALRGTIHIFLIIWLLTSPFLLVFGGLFNITIIQRVLGLCLCVNPALRMMQESITLHVPVWQIIRDQIKTAINYGQL